MLEKNKTCAFISLENIKSNYEFAKNIVGDKDVLAVVKANAYGHGASEVASMLQNEANCRCFAVANLDEAVALRKSGIKGMILVLGYTFLTAFEYLAEYDISQAVTSVDHLLKIENFAKTNNRQIKIHIKLETGMNRIGFFSKSDEDSKLLMQAANILKNSNNLIREGIFTHFATAEEPETEFCELQIKRYLHGVSIFESNGVSFKIHHACNSAGTFYFKNAHFDMVRFGIGLYGYGENEENLKPAMEFSTSIIALHNLKKGEGIGYNLTYTAGENKTIATIAAGYADGFRRELSNRGFVYICGNRCKILGKICMDMAMVDVTEIKNNVKIGDRVEIFGKNISCEEQAKLCETISYELLCGIGERVPRVYNAH